MKNKNLTRSLLALAVTAASVSAQAEIVLYDKEGTTFSADGLLNAFYTRQEQGDQDVSRVRMGFLPNYIGFNVSKEQGDLTLGARSSFWVTINDVSNDDLNGDSETDTGIDVRQFYGTVDGDWGQVLFGKDFGLYARSNIFNDELLLGVGFAPQNSVRTTFGNITTGYPYANPNTQITYRTPTANGFQLAVGILDPSYSNDLSRYSEEPRFEAELTYNADYNGLKIGAWLGGAMGETTTATDSVDAQGLAYGVQLGYGGFKVTASGFDQEGIPTTFTSNVLDSEIDSDGYLVQTSYTYKAVRGVLSYGNVDAGGSESELSAGAVFYNVTDNLKLVGEYSVYEPEGGDDIDTLALGAVLTW
ncbi:porin [Marinobacterium mangrovicola]|uniref:Putative porin n=1 Tax=Marinobacterium mangrovicola TaxID=1476959 RepID=A0A4R1GKJ3_9GAMM|nr:porin [Marinobacterium mangrovicola]TCK08947.1 putative porin [Marinobacterium mangrovicola]